jgi:hypothetical protein
MSGAAFGTQPIVEVRDAAGNRVTTDSTTTVQLAAPTATGTVGTTSRTASSGVATFTNAGIVGVVGSTHSLVFSTAGLTSATQTIQIAPFSFGNGTYLIGASLPPGQYRSVNDQEASCYWARLRDTSGASGSIIANDIGPGPRLVEILASDYAFESSRCAQWSQVTGPVTSSPTAPFANGVYVVGLDVQPGLWRSQTSGSNSCYWARLKNTTGSDDILANDIGIGPRVVEIVASDKAFESSSCSQWSRVIGPITSSPTAPFSDGVYVVGVDIQPGTWRSDGSGSSCYWERLRNFTGNDEIIDNYLGSAPAVVTILTSDVGFSASRCGTWSKVP